MEIPTIAVYSDVDRDALHVEMGDEAMRLVEGPEDLDEALERSSREATSYFGRSEVYLERYITKAHHVEAQILADAHGHFSFLGERDCSMQRRYQKLIEEGPSPI